MAIAPADAYPAQTIVDVDYPQGKARNITVVGDNTGTPLEAAWVNDLWGFLQAILATVGELPSGTPDSINASQYLNGLRSLMLSWRSLNPAVHDNDLLVSPSAQLASGKNVIDVILPLSADRVYTINDASCVDGDWLLVRNRSAAFNIVLNAPSGGGTLATLRGVSGTTDWVLVFREGGTWRRFMGDLRGDIKYCLDLIASQDVQVARDVVVTRHLVAGQNISGVNQTRFLPTVHTDTSHTIPRNNVIFGGELAVANATWTIDSAGETNGHWVELNIGDITSQITISSSSGTLLVLEAGVIDWATCVLVGSTWRVLRSGRLL